MPNATQPCRVEKGRNYTIRIDFTPTMTTSEVEVVPKAFGIINWPGYKTKSCKNKFVQCPVEENKKATYEHSFLVRDDDYPTIKVPVNWKVMLNHSEIACFLFLWKL